jgi:diacylglycerol kinase
MSGISEYLYRRIRSFKYAFNGIGHVILNEANFRIHLAVAILVVILGFWLHISKSEWLFIVLTIGMVMAAEIFNSSIEKLMDLLHPEQNRNVGIIKDISAGAVLVTALSALIVGLYIFIPKIIPLL